MVGAQPGHSPKAYLEQIRATIATGGDAGAASAHDDDGSASDWSDSGSEGGEAGPAPAAPPSLARKLCL